MAIVVDVHEVWCHRIPNEHIIVPYLQPTDVEWVINYCRFVFVGTKIFSYTFGAILSVNVVFEPYKKRYIGSFENLYFQPFFLIFHILNLAARFTCDYLMSHIYEPDGTILVCLLYSSINS